MNLNILNGKFNLCRGSQVWSKVSSLKVPMNPLIANIIGHLTFDGNLNINKDGNGGRVRFYGSEEKLRNLQHDIERNLNIKVYREQPFRIERKFVLAYHKTEFARGLIRLGAIDGAKVLKKFSVPEWIFRGSRKIKVAYLQALLDDEGEKLRKVDKKPNSWNGLKIKLRKETRKKKALKDFLIQLKTMFEELGVKTSKIGFDKKEFQRRDGKNTIGGYFRISTKKSNRELLVKKFNFREPSFKMPLMISTTHRP